MNRKPLKISLKVLWVSLIIFGLFFQNGTTKVESVTDSPDPRIGVSGAQEVTEAAAGSSHTIYLPEVRKNYQPYINVEKIWTSDSIGAEKIAFLPGEAITYNVKGSNYTGEIAAADVNWTQEGPCGPTSVLSGTLDLDMGPWSFPQLSSAPDCNGIYTHTLKITHNNVTTILQTRFVVNYPSEVVLSETPAFDKCHVPSLSQMQKWWDKSPYTTSNIYIGGISQACSNDGLDALWVHQASQQGWSLIPTWVGPQAACSPLKYRMSTDPSVSYVQGKFEADLAYKAAKELGLLGNHVIYYDLEGYWGANTTCRQASAAFLRGWVERLHEYGVRAGAYGSSCSSYMTDWASNNPMPDDVWIAHWSIPYQYDPDATVWGTACLSDSLWANHQRIRQYAGDHTETWGSVSLVIDSNIADGEVTSIPSSVVPASAQVSSPVSLAYAPPVRSMQLLSPELGWALVDNQLFWTEDSGLIWRDISPSDASDQILAVEFLNDSQGWLVARSNGSGDVSIQQTADGGETWQIQPLPYSPADSGFAIGSAYLTVLDPQTAWVVLKYQTGSSFSLGTLYKTTDSGKTWDELS
ncbi:MAG TPA: glycoside hydrolase domain-containing protein, partial [Anaerolineales bacterium]|nr:glycoside hydrolase domain-containing protein [Anaerolineales bacterium]